MTEMLLNKIYRIVKTKVNSLLINYYLNVFNNEFINIRKKRVINLYVHVSKTITFIKKEFYLKVKVDVTEIMNVKIQAR